MKIALFGATGHTGKFILREALAAGHNLSVLVRNPSKLPPGKYGLTIHLGDALDADNVEDTVFGQGAVISALGLSPNGKADSLSTATANIIGAMQANGLRRLVVIGGAGILLDDESGTLRLDTPGIPEQYRVFALEHQRVYAALQASDLDWTLLCPPTMYEEDEDIRQDSRSELRTEVDVLPKDGRRATYAAVGSLALGLVSSGQYIHRRVGVAE
jgi:putative NADH-flavin reductase